MKKLTLAKKMKPNLSLTQKPKPILELTKKGPNPRKTKGSRYV